MTRLTNISYALTLSTTVRSVFFIIAIVLQI